MSANDKWMLHDMEHATVVTAEKPGRAIADFNSTSFTAEENEQHAQEAIDAVNGETNADLLEALEAIMHDVTAFNAGTTLLRPGVALRVDSGSIIAARTAIQKAKT